MSPDNGEMAEKAAYGFMLQVHSESLAGKGVGHSVF